MLSNPLPSLRALLTASALLALSCTRASPRGDRPPITPTHPAITAGELEARLSVFAADSMRGRMAGDEGNVRATAYLAAAVSRLALEPAGENGTYFQTVPLAWRVFDDRSSLRAESGELRPWIDYLPRDQGAGARPLDGVQVVYGGVWGDSTKLLRASEAQGKLVVLRAPAGPDGKPQWSGVPRDTATDRYRAAAGIAVATLDLIPAEEQAPLRESILVLAAADSTPVPSYMYVTRATARALLGSPPESLSVGAVGRTVRGRLIFVERPPGAPARNVVAVVRGSDPRLRGQFVALGAHNDHVGPSPAPVDHDSVRIFSRALRPEGAFSPEVAPSAAKLAAVRARLHSARKRRPPRPDSIFNGADDDGTGSVALLEIAEAFMRARPKRSVLFVWHTAEELGLYGSQWFTDHPTVPRDSIVVQLQMDAIGRGTATDLKGGGPAYLQLVGSRRLSTELGEIAEDVNKSQQLPFTFDYSTDAPGHPLQLYCRSDHAEYARYGIPAALFFTGFHSDFHQVTDEPQYIDYPKLARVTQLVYAIARRVADLDHRLVVDKPKPDPKAACAQ